MVGSAEVFELLQTGDSLAVVCHDDPDPDTLASALALGHLADSAAVETVDILHGGSVSNRQNRSFVDAFDIELSAYTEEARRASDLVALVDHALPGVHNQLPAGASVDIVIDHHPPAEAVPGRVVDVRPGYGATATILAEYLETLGVEITTRVASGLLFALHRERLDFVRSPTIHEYAAAESLHPHADLRLLRTLYGASFTEESVEVMAAAIENREVRDRTLTSFVGGVDNRDVLVPAADYLLNLAAVDVVLVAGIVDDVVHLSARTLRADLDLGTRLRAAFADVGQAGGHTDMAGGQLSLGALVDDRTSAETDEAVVERALRRRFREALSERGR